MFSENCALWGFSILPPPEKHPESNFLHLHNAWAWSRLPLKWVCFSRCLENHQHYLYGWCWSTISLTKVIHNMFLGTCIYQETFPFERQKKLFCSIGAHNKRKFNKASIACYTMLLRARSKWAGSNWMGLYACNSVNHSPIARKSVRASPAKHSICCKGARWLKFNNHAHMRFFLLSYRKFLALFRFLWRETNSPDFKKYWLEFWHIVSHFGIVITNTMMTSGDVFCPNGGSIKNSNQPILNSSTLS